MSGHPTSPQYAAGEPAMTLATDAGGLDVEARPARRRAAEAHCFDVFETLLTRAVCGADDLLLLLGRRLHRQARIPCSAEVFARQRAEAERRAVAICGAHPPLAAIYRELSQLLALRPEAAADMAAEEMALERELSVPLPGAAALLDAARRRCGRAVFVTDINLPAGFVQELLQAQDFWQPGDLLFASCDCGVDKARGLMFPHVAGAVGVHPRRILHHGNDRVADVRNARLSGWRVRHLGAGNPTRYERALAAHRSTTEGLSSLMAGASRSARLAVTPATERERVLAEVAAGVMAPMLSAWMLWLLQRARQEGLRRLYFLSRDGQVLLGIAERLETVLQTGIEFRYLHGSRRAMQLSGAPERAMQEFLRHDISRLGALAEALGLPYEELVEHLPPELRRVGPEANLGPIQRQLMRLGIGDAGFARVVRASTRRTRELLSDYLRQEGWAEDVPFGLVDVGWQANIARALSDAFEGTDIRLPRRHFFFGLADTAQHIAGPELGDRLEAWFFDDARRLGCLPPLPSVVTLVEMFCAADHGTVLGYQRRGDRVEPLLERATSPAQDWGLPLLRRVTAAFLDAMLPPLRRDPGLVDLRSDLRPAIRDALDLFWLAPTRAEVRHWGDFPVEEGFAPSLVLPIAEPMPLREVLGALRRGTLRLRRPHTWPMGAALLSPWPVRATLRLAWWLRRELPRLRRRLSWARQLAPQLRPGRAPGGR
ncbi:hypothetical protein [Falsiroseomonas sp.]|uniref:hypothetical protein n=1 Tax=Falsiroseomonas sp. TaxID=2870721 RepID=UPI003569C5C0